MEHPVLYIVTIEGNIGAGKTTLLREIHERVTEDKRVNYLFIAEPVDEWTEKIRISEDLQDVMTEEQRSNCLQWKSPLEYLYQGIEKGEPGAAFPFQITAFATRAKALKKTVQRATKDKPLVIVAERCLLSDREIFTKQLISLNMFKPEEIFAYEQVWDLFFEDWADKLKGMILVDTSSGKCRERVEKRERRGEREISLEYLESIEKRHENLLKKVVYNLHVQRVDNNVEFQSEKYREAVTSSVKFIEDMTTSYLQNRIC